MANASGGRVVYGIREGRNEAGILVPAGYAPVQDNRFSREWLTNVLTSSSSPPLRAFDIDEVVVPADHGGGRLLIVSIEQATTAHQCLGDHRYYSRYGVKTDSMPDHQIRDVMGRRTAPVIEVKYGRRFLARTENQHQYEFVFSVANTGLVSLQDWTLEIDFPASAWDAEHFRALIHTPATRNVVREQIEYVSAQYHSMALARRSPALHPGQRLDLDGSVVTTPLHARVTGANIDRLHRDVPPIEWRLYMPVLAP